MAFGSGASVPGDAGGHTPSQTRANIQDEGSSQRSDSHRFGPFSEKFVPVVSRKSSQQDPTPSALFVPAGRLLTVKQVAQLLQVSTSTVYALCERGELAHSRVMNSIRVFQAEVKAYLTRTRG